MSALPVRHYLDDAQRIALERNPVVARDQLAALPAGRRATVVRLVKYLRKQVNWHRRWS